MTAYFAGTVMIASLLSVTRSVSILPHCEHQRTFNYNDSDSNNNITYFTPSTLHENVLFMKYQISSNSKIYLYFVDNKTQTVKWEFVSNPSSYHNVMVTEYNNMNEIQWQIAINDYNKPNLWITFGGYGYEGCILGEGSIFGQQSYTSCSMLKNHVNYIGIQWIYGASQWMFLSNCTLDLGATDVDCSRNCAGKTINGTKSTSVTVSNCFGGYRSTQSMFSQCHRTKIYCPSTYNGTKCELYCNSYGCINTTLYAESTTNAFISCNGSHSCVFTQILVQNATYLSVLCMDNDACIDTDIICSHELYLECNLEKSCNNLNIFIYEDAEAQIICSAPYSCINLKIYAGNRSNVTIQCTEYLSCYYMIINVTQSKHVNIYSTGNISIGYTFLYAEYVNRLFISCNSTDSRFMSTCSGLHLFLNASMSNDTHLTDRFLDIYCKNDGCWSFLFILSHQAELCPYWNITMDIDEDHSFDYVGVWILADIFNKQRLSGYTDWNWYYLEYFNETDCYGVGADDKSSVYCAQIKNVLNNCQNNKDKPWIIVLSIIASIIFVIIIVAILLFCRYWRHKTEVNRLQIQLQETDQFGEEGLCEDK